MNAWENSHRHITRVVADKHFVNFEYRSESLGKCFCRDMCQVEINLILSADTFAFQTNLKDLTRCYISRNEIAVCRISVLKKIPALIFRNISRTAFVGFVLWNPDTPTLTTSRFAHQAKLVLTWNRGWMHLNEFAIGIASTLLITG